MLLRSAAGSAADADDMAAQRLMLSLRLHVDGVAAAVAAVAITRFWAMLFEQCGGRKAIREVIRTGKLVEVNLGQPESRERAYIPQRRPRHGPARRQSCAPSTSAAWLAS